MTSTALERCTALRAPGEMLDGDRILLHRIGCDALTTPLRWFAGRTGDRLIQWPHLSCDSRWTEKQLRGLDLLFTLAYGGIIAAGLWWVWTTAGNPFHPAWIIAPLAVIMTSDWTDHLIHLPQLRHYVPSNEERLETLVIQIASYATVIKLWFTLGLYVSLAGLAVRVIVRLSDRRLGVVAQDNPYAVS